MRITCDTVFSTVAADPYELARVREALTPGDWEDEGQSFLQEDQTFYTGLLPYLRMRLGTADVQIEVTNEWVSPFRDHPPTIPADYLATPAEPEFRLRDYQQVSIHKALMAGRGTIEAAAGAGKTEIAAGLLRWLSEHRLIRRALVITGTAFLLHQTHQRLQRRGLRNVGILGDEERDIEGRPIVVATVQTLARGLRRSDEELRALVTEADCIIADEVHHLRAKQWVNVVASCPAPWRFGLTATLWDDPEVYSSSDLYLLGLTGPSVVRITMRTLINRGFLAEPLVVMPEVRHPKVNIHPRAYKAWDRVYEAGILEHRGRNSMVLSFAAGLYDLGFRVMIFVARIEHGRQLLRWLRLLDATQDCLLVHGGNAVEYWANDAWQYEEWGIERIAALVNNSARCIIIGTQVLDEGVDIPVINALAMAGGQKKYRRTVQRAGRGMRPKAGDNHVYILDPYDLTHPFLKSHAHYRRWTYEQEGFAIYDDTTELELRLGLPLPLDPMLLSTLQEDPDAGQDDQPGDAREAAARRVREHRARPGSHRRSGPR